MSPAETCGQSCSVAGSKSASFGQTNGPNLVIKPHPIEYGLVAEGTEQVAPQDWSEIDHLSRPVVECHRERVRPHARESGDPVNGSASSFYLSGSILTGG